MPFQLAFTKTHSYVGSKNLISLPVILKVGGEEVNLIASLDTGASHCLFQRSYADTLGLDVERGDRKTFATANSTFDAFGHEVTLITLDIEVSSMVYFFADPAIVRNVLGRGGWLDRVKIGIVDYDQVLYLTEYDTRPE